MDRLHDCQRCRRDTIWRHRWSLSLRIFLLPCRRRKPEFRTTGLGITILHSAPHLHINLRRYDHRRSARRSNSIGTRIAPHAHVNFVQWCPSDPG